MSYYSENIYNKDRENDAWTKVASFVEGGWKILDIGCSSGRLGKALKDEKSVTVVGIDIDEEDIKEAKKNLDKAFVLNIEQDYIPKDIGKFDAIIMADVIEHLVNPTEAVKKVKKLLKPGGKLIFSIPNMANATVRLELLSGRFEYKNIGLLDKTHLHFYDQAEVERVLAESGFEIEKFNNTVRSIPKDILEKELSKLGIKLTQELEKHLNEPKAIYYQFVGVARPAKGKIKHARTQTSSHLDAVAREIENIKEYYEKLLKQKDGKTETLMKDKEHLKNELEKIYNSRGWKLLALNYNIRHKISSLLKKRSQ